MKKAEKLAAQYRSEICSDLVELSRKLEAERVCRDVGPLLSASEECRHHRGGHWGYSIVNLIFVLAEQDLEAIGCFPECVSDVSCSLTWTVSGIYSDPDDGLDPMERLESSIKIVGRHGGGGIDLAQCWHFDRHIGSQVGRVAHPRYHFQHGGRRMEEHAEANCLDRFDGALLLGSPRIAHPPLDGVLAIDFLLSNFLGEQWRSLRSNDNVYVRLVRRAQERYWRPYVGALDSAFKRNTSGHNWLFGDVWPQFCPVQ